MNRMENEEEVRECEPQETEQEMSLVRFRRTSLGWKEMRFDCSILSSLSAQFQTTLGITEDENWNWHLNR